ncbi:MAG: hypothetical protein O7G85_05190, partial [Planctomycetota bacterium]|nr:hypothetical protein [Planctomycetota bacterium]
AAGLHLQSISLRSVGGAALIDAMPQSDEQSDRRVLLVDITGSNIEFNIIEQGGIRFSRAGTITRDGSDSHTDSALLREIRRTWMSYRIVDEDSRVDEALLLGDATIDETFAASIESMLQIKTDELDRHPIIDAGETLMQGLWPLAGLLMASHQSKPSIDFLHPRRAPDVRARTRQLSLAAAGVLIIAMFGAWTMARRTLAPLESKLENLQTDNRKLAPHYRRYGRDLYKLEHLRRWEATRIDWLEHASALQTLSPTPGQVVLDEWRGTLSFRGVQFDHRENVWSAPKDIVIVLEGEAADRKTADAFRAALVETSLYTASSGGTDTEGGKRLPYGFTYRLTTDSVAPPEEKASAPSQGPGE